MLPRQKYTKKNNVKKEVERMLKGIGRSVVVVSDVESDLFEQAIFILSPKGASGYVNDSDEVVKEARKVLSGYTAKYYMAQKKRSKSKSKNLAMWITISVAVSFLLGVILYGIC